MTTVRMTTQFKITDADKVIQSAEELGRLHGRDDDWQPKDLQDALLELEDLGVSDPEANGYVRVARSIY